MIRTPVDYRKNLATVSSLRVPCAIFVFLHHIEGHFGIPIGTFPFRRIVVSLFLVLSGYLLYSIYGTRETKTPLLEFYRKRVARIFPLHICVFVLAYLLHWQNNIRNYSAEPVYHIIKSVSQLTLVQCWFPTKDFVLGLNGVTWTLSVILFCYLLFPLLVRTGKWLFVVFIGLLALDLFLIGWVSHQEIPYVRPSSIVHFFPIFRTLEFIAGMLAAQVCQFQLPKNWNQKRLLMTIFDLCVIVLFFAAWFNLESWVMEKSENFENPVLEDTFSRWFSRVGFAMPSCAILIWYSISNGWVAGGLRSKLMVFLGNVSYAFYLCHRGIILKSEEWLSNYDLSITTLVIITFTIVFAFSTALYLIVERPLRYWFGGKRKQPSRATTDQARRSERVDFISACGIIGLALVLFSFYQTNWPPRQVMAYENGLNIKFNQIIERNNEVTIRYSWRYEQKDEVRVVAHFFDRKRKLVGKKRILHLRPRRRLEHGIRTYRFKLEELDGVARIGIGTWTKTTKKIATIQETNAIEKKLFANDRFFEIWRAPRAKRKLAGDTAKGKL